MVSFLAGLLDATVQAATVLLLAGMGELISERAGVLNLGVEGMMLVGALGGFIVTVVTGSYWLGFGAGIVVGLFAFALPVIGHVGAGLVAGVVAGVLAGGGVASGAWHGLLAGSLGGILLGLVFGVVGAVAAGPIGGLIGGSGAFLVAVLIAFVFAIDSAIGGAVGGLIG